MSSVAGRKKSVVSSAGLQIETPVANNTFLNKSAAQSTSLYQQCSQLRARLLHVHDFPPYFSVSAPSETRTSTDPVTQLWDCFALGTPLCFLHNLLPGVSPIASINTDPQQVDPTDEKASKKAIVYFAMAIRTTDLFDHADQFLATELLNRGSTEGFVKVVNCVTRLVDRLPESCFQEAPPMSPPSLLPSQESSDSMFNPDSPSQAGPANAQEMARNNIVREMVETERKYVQDLEHMQKYANELSSSSAIDQDTIHLLFPGLNKLLDFQRRFLIKLEGVAELPWKEQRWGLPFVENEDDFAVYEPYCANYSKAVDIMVASVVKLQTVTLIDAKSELPAFLIKPVQRICKYPLLLESLLKAAANSDYPFLDELKKGNDAAKRITERINEAQRRSENLQTIASLETRVEDWKGHHLSNFGELILDDIFMVMKMDIDREYHVFLFEKIILCCKEVLPASAGGSTRKSSKSNSILKKQPAVLPGGLGPPRKKTTPLLLKGRIFLNNVTHTRPIIQTIPGSPTPSYALQVWWRGDDDNEYFTLRCRTDETLNKWESEINRLIERTQSRKNSESQRFTTGVQANSTNPSQSRQLYDAARKLSTVSSATYITGLPGGQTYSINSRRYPQSGYEYEEYRTRSGSVPIGGYYVNVNGAGPSGYPAADDDYEQDDNYEEYPPTNQYQPLSGRGTPSGGRRGNISQSMVQEREAPYYDRPRARTEDQNGAVLRQWRKNGQPMPAPPPPPVGALPNPLAQLKRPQAPSRIGSDMSEASFGPGVSVRSQPTLRSKFSSTRLNSSYDDGSERAISPLTRVPSRPPMRSRSASQPSAYQPPQQIQPPPPLPKSQWLEATKDSAVGTVDTRKRGSGSSESTGGESSDYSPHSTSPITPFGSSDSSLAGSTLRTSKSQMLQKSVYPSAPLAPVVKVKVHFLEDIFVIQVPKSTEYEDLVDKVGKRIRLCGSRNEDGPLKVKYVDEDGDMVSLGSTEDVQMAFESTGNIVTLYVS